jgi:hypothetical protein
MIDEDFKFVLCRVYIDQELPDLVEMCKKVWILERELHEIEELYFSRRWLDQDFITVRLSSSFFKRWWFSKQSCLTLL